MPMMILRMFASYLSLKETPVFLSVAKLSLAETVYAGDTKVKCRLFGNERAAYFH